MSRWQVVYVVPWRNTYTFCLMYITLINTVSGLKDPNAPAIVDGIASPLKSLGESVELNCTVKNRGNLQVYWRQDFNKNDYVISKGRDILATNPVAGEYPNNVTKYELDVTPQLTGSETYLLTIHRLIDLDAGIYTCALVSTSTSTEISKTGTLTLRGVTNGPKIVYDIGQVNSKVGASATLSCTVAYKGSNPVRWVRVSTTQVLSNDNNILVNNPAVNETKKYTMKTTSQNSGERIDLTINRLSTDDSGEYECKVETTTSPAPSKRGTLFVGVPPEISSPNPENITLQMGDGVSLTCTATGSPQPTIIWQKTDFSLLPNGQQTYKGQTISITNVNERQRGLYRCQASNGVAPAADKTFRVKVEFAPIAHPVHTNVSQAIGFPVTISCVIEGYPDVTPTWYKVQSGGRTKVTEDVKHIVTHTPEGASEQISTTRFSLRIEQVAASDYGPYQCEGVSFLGTNYITMRLSQSASCEGKGCSYSNPGGSEVKSRETTTCSGDCTGGTPGQHHLGSSGVLLLIPTFLSFYLKW